MNGAIIGLGVALAVAVFVLADDAVIGIAAGAGFYAIATRLNKARTGRIDRQNDHREYASNRSHDDDRVQP